MLDNPIENRIHKLKKPIELKGIKLSESINRVKKTMRFIKILIKIKKRILLKHKIDKSIGIDMSINSPPTDISWREILWLATKAIIRQVKKNNSIILPSPIKINIINDNVGHKIKR